MIPYFAAIIESEHEARIRFIPLSMMLEK
jgi:hypothetical protein